jgi:hypothetical protein
MESNSADRCTRPVASARKNILLVGSKRAGHAAAVWYTLDECCKLTKVNPLTDLALLLENVRDRAVDLPRPDPFGKAGHGLPMAI